MILFLQIIYVISKYHLTLLTMIFLLLLDITGSITEIIKCCPTKKPIQMLWQFIILCCYDSFAIEKPLREINHGCLLTSKYQHLVVMLHEAFEVLFWSNRFQRRADKHHSCDKIQPCNPLLRWSPKAIAKLIIQILFTNKLSRNICDSRIKCGPVTPYGDIDVG